MRKAFTLIELLVVIAIIAILAAILFPVFAQAKSAAKQTAAISNVKQQGTAQMLYAGDADDLWTPIWTNQLQPSGQERWISWKLLLQPYIKSRDIFRDPMNPAAKYLDDASDPAQAIYRGIEVAPENERFPRGYSFLWAWYLTGTGSANGFGSSNIENPANLMMVHETKMPWVAFAPWDDWRQNDTAYEADGVGKGLGWNWGGKKWDEKAMSIVYFDGHAKRAAHRAICGRDDEVNQWGYQRNRLGEVGAYDPGYTALGLDLFCKTIPAGL